MAGRLAGGDEALPRQARAEAVGAQQRIEAAPAAHLAAPERDIDLAGSAVARGGILDAVDEARERALDADAQRAAEGPLERPRVVGHLAADGLDDVLGEVGEHRPQSGGELGWEVLRHSVGTRLQIRCRFTCVRIEKSGEPVPYAQPMTRPEKIVNLLAVVLPPLIIVTAIVVFWNEVVEDSARAVWAPDPRSAQLIEPGQQRP